MSALVRRRRSRLARRNPTPPTSMLGAVAYGAAGVAATTAAGLAAGYGYCAVKSCSGPEPVVGAIWGATIAPVAVGLGLAAFSKPWRSTGFWMAGIGAAMIGAWFIPLGPKK